MSDDSLPTALARMEGKVDALLQSFVLLNTSINDMDSRLREVEREVAALKQQQFDEYTPRVSWAVVLGSAVAALTLGWLVLKEVFKIGG